MNRLARASRSVWSYLLGLRASWRRGRVYRLERQERKAEALRMARAALDMLRLPGVHRERSAEGSALVALTVAVERLSLDLQEPGVPPVDIRDSISVLKELGSRGDLAIASFPSEWLSYLEQRLELAGVHETIH